MSKETTTIRRLTLQERETLKAALRMLMESVKRPRGMSKEFAAQIMLEENMVDNFWWED